MVPKDRRGICCYADAALFYLIAVKVTAISRCCHCPRCFTVVTLAVTVILRCCHCPWRDAAVGCHGGCRVGSCGVDGRCSGGVMCRGSSCGVVCGAGSWCGGRGSGSSCDGSCGGVSSGRCGRSDVGSGGVVAVAGSVGVAAVAAFAAATSARGSATAVVGFGNRVVGVGSSSGNCNRGSGGSVVDGCGCAMSVVLV